MINTNKLNIGDASDNGQVTIIDEDRLCYLVKSTSRGAYGLRTISKSLLSEYVEYFAKKPDASANDAIDALCGNTDIDKFEYGYTSTLKTMAQMVLGQVSIISATLKSVTKPQKHPILPLQTIFYGAPGTGKSNTIKREVEDKGRIHFRTTFHPDSDYSTFVGCYKPTQEETTPAKQPILDYDTLVDKFKEYLNVANVNITKACTLFGYDYHDSIIEIQNYGKKVLDLVNDAYKSNTSYDSVVRGGMACYESHPTTNNTNSITYQFVPQAFTKAYCEAWNNYNPEGGSEPVFLIIEEINRGNCAQIFGDIFQLLDREMDGTRCGFSTYPIDADEDLKKFLLNGTKEDGTPWLVNKDGIKDGKLCLPANLHIWATMNTSDQSLFPIDSAFKRRWDWEYVPIKRADKEPEKEWIIKVTHGGKTYWCYWWEFLEAINHQIEETTHSEDKQLGYFFAKPKAGENFISTDTFVNKVIFYLWNDVFKDEDSAVFQYDNDKVEDVSINRSGTMYFRHFMENKDEMIHYFINQLFAMGKESTPVVPIDYLKNDAKHLPKMREGDPVKLDDEAVDEETSEDNGISVRKSDNIDKIVFSIPEYKKMSEKLTQALKGNVFKYSKNSMDMKMGDMPISYARLTMAYSSQKTDIKLSIPAKSAYNQSIECYNYLNENKVNDIIADVSEKNKLEYELISENIVDNKVLGWRIKYPMTFSESGDNIMDGDVTKIVEIVKELQKRITPIMNEFSKNGK